MKISTENFCRIYEQSIINLSKQEFDNAGKLCLMLVKLGHKYANCKYYPKSSVSINANVYAKLMILASY